MSRDGIPVFDKSVALEIIEGDEAFLKELAAEFLAQSQKAIDSVEEASKSSDQTFAERAAHNLKSMSAHLGGLRLSSIAEEMESSAQQGDWDAYAEKVPLIKQEMPMLIKAFRREGILP